MASCHVSIVELTDGRRVCLSYNVPVAAYVPKVGYIRTDKKYSVTSSRHANAFVAEASSCRVLPHLNFLKLIAPIGGHDARQT